MHAAAGQSCSFARTRLRCCWCNRSDVGLLEPRKRPVSAVADYTEIRGVKKVTIREHKKMTLRLLFDPEHNLEDRILNEQFSP